MGDAGDKSAERLTFERYTLRLGLNRDRQELDSLEYATTSALWSNPSPRAQAQWQWRAGLPLMVFVLALMAQPLSQVNPRQGALANCYPPSFYTLPISACCWQRSMRLAAVPGQACWGMAGTWSVLRAGAANAVALAT